MKRDTQERMIKMYSNKIEPHTKPQQDTKPPQKAFEDDGDWWGEWSEY